jgi:catechol 2,3-dioxygenase-like lactoylglutathione lyase family enzyme
MKLNANGLSHLGLRVTNLARAKRFYVDTLGCQLVREIDGAVLVNMYGTLIALYGADSSSSGEEDHFDPFRVGLDHLALAIEDTSILEDLQRDLDAAGVRNNGVEVDPETHDKYISFYDPDGIAWELYSISTQPDA